ncbi:hypothetical protein [Lyngbya confervoides]|uniref:Addiction module component n=1 Tax=Lyngbya confervoides BDU141951 TaxID=1574623 RepID=A0ABD4SZK9_9CYAN|nr:hypothetical protein [Lyngbya confervoides]MCM1981785.1 hypothetical protein [Lyngbya confervoides BDU141951]
MTLQDIIKSLDTLSVEDQAVLLKTLEQRLGQTVHGEASISSNQPSDETFWEMTLRFRERMKHEEIEFTDEDFADLRDRSPGREVDLC